MKIVRLLAVAAIAVGTATSVFAAPVPNVAQRMPPALEQASWVWHHHHRVWVPAHYHHWYR